MSCALYVAACSGQVFTLILHNNGYFFLAKLLDAFFRKSILFFFLLWDCRDKSLLTGHEAAWKEHIVPKSWFGFPVTTQCHHPSFNYKLKIFLWIFFCFVLFYLIFYSTTISWMNRNDTGLHPLSLSLCINKGQGTLFYLNNHYTSNNNANNNNKRLLITVMRTILVS